MQVADRLVPSRNQMKIMHRHLSVRLSRAAELEYRRTKSAEGRLTVKG
jgi:hypothetical protein